MTRLSLILLIVLGLSACSVRAPELDASISVDSRSADWPELVPLGPLLDRTDAQELADAGQAGRSLEWRAANLRRRAAILRAIRLN